MTQQLDDALRDAMYTATQGIEPSPGLTGEVVRGGRRRQVRGRLFVCAAAALAVTGSVTLPATLPLGNDNRSDVPQPAQSGAQTPSPAPSGPVAIKRGPRNPLFDGPVRGSLSGDTHLGAAALAEWRQPTGRSSDGLTGAHPLEEATGPPRLVWLGETSTGRAAVVAQDFTGPMTPGTAVGVMVADKSGHLRMRHVQQFVESGPSGPGDPLAMDAHAFSFIVDGAHPQLVVVPENPKATVRAALDHSFDAKGKVVRAYHHLTVSDGVAATSLPAGPPDVMLDVRVAGRSIYVGEPTNVPFDMISAPPAHGLLTGCFETCMIGRSSATTPPGDDSDNRVAWAKRHSTGRALTLAENWRAFVALDGASLTGSQLHLPGDQASTVIALARKGHEDEIIFDQVVDEKAALPLQVKIPDNRGWLVAAQKGSMLRWRTPGGAWQSVRGTLALLPATPGIVVQVTHGGTTTEVPLN